MQKDYRKNEYLTTGRFVKGNLDRKKKYVLFKEEKATLFQNKRPLFSFFVINHYHYNL